MVGKNASKLNRLQRSLPEGLVVDTAWLEKEGYSRQLLSKYVASGWLLSPARGVYQRPFAKVGRDGVIPNAGLDWERVISSLQLMLHHPVTVGGRTALEMQGLGHYVTMYDAKEVHLYSLSPMPKWLSQLKLEARLVVHHRKLFSDGLDEDSRNLDDPTWSFKERGSPSHKLYRWKEGRWPLIISTPERAILEVIAELPEHESFEQVDALMDGLGTLSPRKLQALLECCQSFKVKRLFLFLAARHNHAWLQHLDLSRINLGKGKRAIVEHGRYDPKYQITVPAFLLKERHGL
jgi:hypothetical protein